MPSAQGVRASFAIVATVVSIALAAGFGVWAVQSASPSGPCPMFYGAHMYCTGTVTTFAWCHEPAPCPHLGNFTVVLGYTFHVWPMVLPNGTPAVSVSILGFGASGTGSLLLSNPMGTPVDWTSSDGNFLVIWTNAPPSWATTPPATASVLCGVAGS